MTNQSDQPTNVGSNEELDAGGGDNSQFEEWYSIYECTGKGTKQQMREAYFAGLKEARDGAASRLIDVWIANHGQRIDWKRAVNIIAVIQRLPNADRERLLALDD